LPNLFRYVKGAINLIDFIVNIVEIYSEKEKSLFEACRICPRECLANRLTGSDGYCGTDARLNIASVCIHKGEEPCISGTDGICNIFFSGCNLHCIFCQNHEISRSDSSTASAPEMSMEFLLDNIEKILAKGVKSVGFVSPSHMVPQVRAIIAGLHKRNLFPITVYNTSGYDKVETIKSLDGLIDIYLPDFKYFTPALAGAYSDASDYPVIALKAIKEMYYQKGSTLRKNDQGLAENGLVIRHLVLPGHSEESKKVLRLIADELSPGVHLSLMSQYHPVFEVKGHSNLNRSLYQDEYVEVAEEMEKLGFRNGWVQDLDSHRNYRPDFSKENPFD
jgi:putative pyruvate formate lyase activating enzyme